MRRWKLLNSFRRCPDPHIRGRTVLSVEELEGREVPAPLVIAPSFAQPPQTLEGTARFFTGDPQSGGSSFSVSDVGGHTVAANLTSPNGGFNVNVTAAQSFGVTVTGNGVPSVTVTGPIDSVGAFLQSGFNFVPAPNYSGEAAVNLSVTDLQQPGTGSGSFVLFVAPRASQVALNWATVNEVRVPTFPFPFAPGFLAVSQWPDADGSETLVVDLVLGVDDPGRAGEFGLDSSGTPLTPTGLGTWRVSGTGPAMLRAALDSLALIPPPDYSGRVTLTATGSVTDAAAFPSNGTALSDSRTVPGGTLTVRFFEPAVFSTPPVTAAPGGGRSTSVGSTR